MRHAAGPAARQQRERPGDPARQAAQRRGGWLDQLPYAVVFCGLAAGLLWLRGGERDVRGGTLVMAGVLLVAAVARLALPQRRAGMLSTRRRLSDVAAFAVLGVGLLIAGLVFPAAT